MVRESARVAAREGLTNLVTTCADAHHLPFPDDSFAAVLCSNGLQVIPGLRPAASELVRVLAPGGTLFVSVLLARLVGSSRRRAAPGCRPCLRPADDIAYELLRAGSPTSSGGGARLAALMWGEKPLDGQTRRVLVDEADADLAVEEELAHRSHPS